MTPEQQEEFEKAVQQHIQLAVNAALANMPQQPPQPAAVPAVTVNTVVVKLPELWTADPNTWFSQAEASFRRFNVTASYTKYDHLLMKLPCDVVMSVRDLVNSMQPSIRAAQGPPHRQLRHNKMAAGVRSHRSTCPG
jgi:hypothetical protein